MGNGSVAGLGDKKCTQRFDEKYLRKQSLGRSRVWLEIKVDFRPHRWTQWAQDRAPWRFVAFNQIRRNVKPRNKITTSSPTNFDCHETW